MLKKFLNWLLAKKIIKQRQYVLGRPALPAGKEVLREQAREQIRIIRQRGLRLPIVLV